MNLAADRRGRVPFALIGVLLLVSASVYATGLAARTTPAIDRTAANALDATSRDARPALREAARAAASDAARTPVTSPADTPAGRALNDSQPFIDSLRLRIAVGARSALADVGRQRGAIRTTASLPAVDGVSGLEAAKRGVELEPVDGGTAMQVTLRNVSFRAHRGERTVTQRRLNLTFTVRTPVLALHDRAMRYERRLNRGALAGPGLGRGLTARLYPVAAARGYARYGGAPIENVLGNRHIALSTNAALLAQQRAVFGRHDPAAARALEVATLRVGVTDVLGPRNGDAAAVSEAVLRPNALAGDEPPTVRFEPETPDAPPLETSPAAAADGAYLAGTETLSESLAGSYRVTGRLHTQVAERRLGDEPVLDPPGKNWTLLTEREDSRTTVTAGVESKSDRTQAGNTTVEKRRRVTVTHTATRVWIRGGQTQVNRVEWHDVYRVAVAVRAAHSPDDEAPKRPTAPLFRRGGAIDGSNLLGSPERVARTLFAANGGLDRVAVRTASGETETLQRTTTVTATRPTELRPWVTADLRELRARVANVTVNVSRRRFAAGEANPAAKLAERLRSRRAALVNAPAEYDGVADRARVAARAAYLDRIVAALARRAADAESRNENYRDRIQKGSARQLSELVSVGAADSGRGQPSGPTQPERRNAADSLRLIPDASPAYLTTAAVDNGHVPTVPPGERVHPLAVENTNWFAVPYGKAANEVVGALFGGRRVSLETAAGTLVAANQTIEEASGNGKVADGESGATERRAALVSNRARLTNAVSRSVERLERATCEAAQQESGVTEQRCRGAVRELRGQWGGVGHRGLAMSNGSYAAAFISALEHRGVGTATAADAGVRVRVRLREQSAKRKTSVPRETTNQTAAAVRQFGRERAQKLVEAGLANATGSAAKKLTGSSRLPAGLPVAPPPYTWVATVNAWSVTVRGEYQRFALRAPNGPPDGSGAVVRYVRDGSVARVDVDGDGETERLGRSERLNFETETTVVVVVPPGPPGVGDVDGSRTEQSPGWPCPGATGSKGCTARGPE